MGIRAWLRTGQLETRLQAAEGELKALKKNGAASTGDSQVTEELPSEPKGKAVEEPVPAETIPC